MADRDQQRVEEFDVVVVGGGAAGLTAAIEAAERDAQVIVLQKLPEPGGKSCLAIGSISAAGTSLQAAHGIRDTIEQHRADVGRLLDQQALPQQSLLKLDIVLEEAAAAVEWLLELGVTFTGPHPEIPGEPPRLHVITPDVRALVNVLAAQARRRGIRIRGDWAVDRLLTDDLGRVNGAEGRLGAVRSRRGVVLATGDFSAPSRLSPALPVSSAIPFRPWSTGDGHAMAQILRASLSGLDDAIVPQLRTLDWPHIALDPSVFRAGAVLVDSAGSRFCDEKADVGMQTAALGVEDAFVIFDRSVLDQIATAADDSPNARDGWLTTGKLFLATFPGVGYAYVDDLIRSGYAFVEPSLTSLAAKLGISASGLENELTGHGVTAPPFFGCGPWQSRALLGRCGVDVNRHLQVVRADGTPISGLFAAGAVTGPTSYGQGHGFGLAWAVVSGRTCGREVVAA